MEPLLDFSYQLTEKDIAGASDAFSLRWRRCIAPGIVLAIAGIVGLFLEPDWPGPTIGASTVGAVLIYFGTGARGALRRASLRRFRLTPGANQKVHVQVFDDHIATTSDLANGELRWQAFLKWDERPGYVCLFLAPTYGQIIPLTQLAPNQALQFRELVKAHVSASGPRK